MAGPGVLVRLVFDSDYAAGLARGKYIATKNAELVSDVRRAVRALEARTDVEWQKVKSQKHFTILPYSL